MPRVTVKFFGVDALVAGLGFDFVEAVEQEEEGVVFDPGAGDSLRDMVFGVEFFE